MTPGAAAGWRAGAGRDRWEAGSRADSRPIAGPSLPLGRGGGRRRRDRLGQLGCEVVAAGVRSRSELCRPMTTRMYCPMVLVVASSTSPSLSSMRRSGLQVAAEQEEVDGRQVRSHPALQRVHHRQARTRASRCRRIRACARSAASTRCWRTERAKSLDSCRLVGVAGPGVGQRLLAVQVDRPRVEAARLEAAGAEGLLGPGVLEGRGF